MDTKPIRDALWRLAALDSGPTAVALIDAARQALLEVEQTVAIADSMRKAIEPYRAPIGAQQAAETDENGWDLVLTCATYDDVRKAEQ